jgi:hypothetical protein
VLDLLAREHDRDAGFARGADGVDLLVERLLEDVSVKEEERIEGLVLCGGGHAAFESEVGEEGLDLGFAALEIASVLEAVVADEAFDPGAVGAFGMDGVATAAQGEADLIEQG